MAVTRDQRRGTADLAAQWDGAVFRYRRGPTIGPITCDVLAGGCFGLVGANGAGKTTVLRSLIGLQPPDEGQVRVGGQPVCADRLPASTAAMIEEPRFYDWLSAADNLRAMCPAPADAADRISDTLRRVGLDPGSSRPVRAFSQGMRQRLGIARVLTTEAHLMIFDEPTNGLDPVGIRWFRGLTAELVADGHTVVLSSHLLHEVQLACDRYLMLLAGNVVSEGVVADVTQYASLEDLYFAAVDTSSPSASGPDPKAMT